jgi:hypothetical protein
MRYFYFYFFFTFFSVLCFEVVMWVCGNVGNFDNVAKFVHYANNVILIAYDMMMIYDI